jgi:hypothetical protein
VTTVGRARVVAVLALALGGLGWWYSTRGDGEIVDPAPGTHDHPGHDHGAPEAGSAGGNLGSIRGELRNMPGPVQVMASMTSGDGSRDVAVETETATFELPNLAPGTWRVRARSLHRMGPSATVEVGAGDPARVVLEFTTTGIAVDVRVSADCHSVRLTNPEGGFASAVCAPGARSVRFEGVQPGAYELCVNALARDATGGLPQTCAAATIDAAPDRQIIDVAK